MPRRKHDFYETPPHYLRALEWLALPIADQDLVLEPCSGDGAIAKWLEATYGCRVVTNDIDKKRYALRHADATTADFADGDPYTWIISNFPFSQEFEIIANLINQSRNLIALARISFNEPTRSRGSFLATFPPQFVQFLPRYSFRPNDEGKRQADSVTCCWMGWGPDVPKGIFYSLERES